MTSFFGRHARRKIVGLCNNLCHSVTGNSARRSLHTRTAKVRDNRLFGYSAKSLEPPLIKFKSFICYSRMFRIKAKYMRFITYNRKSLSYVHAYPRAYLCQSSPLPLSDAAVELEKQVKS